MSDKPQSKNPENTNKNYNAQNSEDFLSKNKKGSDLSNVERPAQGTTHTAERAKQGSVNQGSQSLKENSTKNIERENVDPNVS